MPKRAFIIHQWCGSPGSDWYPWLKKELEKRGFAAEIPAMPEPESPDIAKWVGFIGKSVGKADRETYFVGHSIGCQAILRYLETGGHIGGAVFVAGWFTLTREAMPTRAEKAIANPWIRTPIDFRKVRQATGNFAAIFSGNDPYVPLENASMFRERLGAKIIIQAGKGHFTKEDGITKVPAALEATLAMAGD
ncbi:MAG: serine hydrolase family protein [Candidatus Aenigmarchaeota archaeon]|nr:serine hydrolase family protein [Candidatus Aenigmarchaeota archaeon]